MCMILRWIEQSKCAFHVVHVVLLGAFRRLQFFPFTFLPLRPSPLSLLPFPLLPSPSPVRARASEEKFSKLREVYQKLRGEHIQLLRTDGEVKKTVQSMEAERMEAEDQRKVQECGWEGASLLAYPQ